MGEEDLHEDGEVRQEEEEGRREDEEDQGDAVRLEVGVGEALFSRRDWKKSSRVP